MKTVHRFLVETLTYTKVQDFKSKTLCIVHTDDSFPQPEPANARLQGYRQQIIHITYKLHEYIM